MHAHSLKSYPYIYRLYIHTINNQTTHTMALIHIQLLILCIMFHPNDASEPIDEMCEVGHT
jgi:hypothetical protein